MTGRLWWVGFWYVLSFFLKEATDVGLRASCGRSFQILGASKAKLWPKCLADLKPDEWKGGTVRY